MTAGSLKSHQMLLDKAVILIKSYTAGDQVALVKIQNILSQFQSSLNLEYESAQELFVSVAPLWDALETGDQKLIEKASVLVEYLRDTIKLLQKK